MLINRSAWLFKAKYLGCVQQRSTEELCLLFRLPKDFEGCNKDGGPQHVFTQRIVNNLATESFPPCAALPYMRYDAASPQGDRQDFLKYLFVVFSVPSQDWCKSCFGSPHLPRNGVWRADLRALPVCLITRHERLGRLFLKRKNTMRGVQRRGISNALNWG